MLIPKNESDFTTTLEKALEEIDPNYQNLNGIIIAGSHAPKDVELKINLIKMAREQNIPILGICLGFQLMCIEYVRTFVPSATSEELDSKAKDPVIVKMPELRVGLYEAENGIKESFWHNYKFNTSYENLFLQEWKLDFKDRILTRMTHLEHPFMVGVAYHPEYQSSQDKPHPLLVEFIKSCK